MMDGHNTVPVGVLERGLLLLNCFSQAKPRLQLRDLADITGMDKATTLRALKTLVAWGFLEKGPDGAYSPGPANLRLAAIFKTTSNFILRLETPIAKISGRVEQTTSFFVRSNDERVCLARDHAFKDVRRFIEVGASAPLSAGGSAAQVLQAYTDPRTAKHRQALANGYYISRRELNAPFASVAVPLFESDGTFLGAVAITGMADELDDPALIGFVDVVREETEKLGFRVEPS